LHPPTTFRKSFRCMILASIKGAGGCTMAARTRHLPNCSPDGRICLPILSKLSWRWCGLRSRVGERVACAPVSPVASFAKGNHCVKRVTSRVVSIPSRRPEVVCPAVLVLLPRGHPPLPPLLMRRLQIGCKVLS
jgi:hypothetical protein